MSLRPLGWSHLFIGQYNCIVHYAEVLKLFIFIRGDPFIIIKTLTDVTHITYLTARQIFWEMKFLVCSEFMDIVLLLS